MSARRTRVFLSTLEDWLRKRSVESGQPARSVVAAPVAIVDDFAGRPVLLFVAETAALSVEELTDYGTEPDTIDRAVRAADLFVVGEVAVESSFDRPASSPRRPQR